MEEVREKPSYYAILPANVRYDERLKPMEKILYAEITALTTAKGFCFASNSYFGKLYGVHKDTAGKWINHLGKLGYIKAELIYKKGTKQIEMRKLYIANVKPIDKKIDTPIDEKSDTPIGKKCSTPIDEKSEDSITSNNITSINIKNIKKEISDKIESSNLSQEKKDKLIEWIEFRKLIKHPVKTVLPISRILKTSFIQKDDACEFIQYCMEREWRGLEDKYYDIYRKSKPASAPMTVEKREYTGWFD